MDAFIEKSLPYPVPAGAQEDEQERPPEEKPAEEQAAEAPAPARPRRASSRAATPAADAGAADATERPAPRRRRQAAPAESDAAAAETEQSAGVPAIPRLRQIYIDTVAPALMQEFNITNTMRVPRLSKIVLNIGAGDARDESRVLEGIQQDLTTISGQKPVVTRAKVSIAGFHIREGNTIGASVTLRGARMWNFLDRLMNVALPRTRDFRGVPVNAFDKRGNYSVGLREQIIFPEIDYNRVDRVRGLQVNIVTTARTDDEGRRLLALLGMPFVREENQ